MRQLRLVAYALLCCSLPAWTQITASGQAAVAPQPAAQKRGWLDSWRNVTVSFGTIEKDAYGEKFYKAIGTGIVFQLTPRTGVIVTAKHVVYDPAKDYHPDTIHIRFPWQESESVYKQFGTVIQLRDQRSRNDLWTALDDVTDIAAIPLSPSIKDQPAVGIDGLAGPDDIFEGANIIALGFPGIVGNEYLIRAISRGGIVAWLNPTNPYDSRFLIDCNIYPGNSGGPVIRVPTGLDKAGNFNLGGKAALLGIVVEAPGQVQETKLTVPGSKLPLTLHQETPLGGTGVVEPASKIRELLQRLQQVTR